MLALRTCSLAALFLCLAISPLWGESWSVDSPGGGLRLTVALDDLSSTGGYPQGVRLYYRVDLTAERQRTVIPFSPLGITRRDQQFVDGLRLVSAGQAENIETTYQLVSGKQRECRILARRRTLVFQNAEGGRCELELHVADDGVAFRYRFPEADSALHTVLSEASGFRLPEGSLAWIQPYQDASQWTPAYEEYFQNAVPAGSASPTAAGWCLPALFQTGKDLLWVLLAEAGVDGGYCGTRLKSEAPGGLYQIRFPDPGEGNGVGAVEPSSTLPWATPWRAVIVGDSLDRIVQSTLVTDLCPPSAVENRAWIKPGRAAWSWWSDHDSPRDYRKQLEFIDLAAEMGWEYYLVDANWTLMDGGNVREMARYAASKGVGLFLWYNSGGEHNFVTEKPRGCLVHPQVRDFEFKLLKEWGIKGIKVDFFQSDKQNMMAYYLDILRDAARHELMINFHGCTAPRGWSRTWPNLLSMEAVKGEECYTFAADYPQKAPWHNTILVFTRNVIGPMDYTPCGFSDDRYPHITTNAHELALSVVFESGLLHLADRVAAYRELPEAPKRFLRQVPVAWDETRLVDGYPGKLAVVARRSGDAWYVGGIQGENQSKAVVLDLGFLSSGEYELLLIGDGRDPRSFASKTMKVRAGDRIDVPLLPFGGFAAKIVPGK